MVHEPEWEEFRSRYSPGDIITATVTEHRPFGIFLDVGSDRFPGLVELPSIEDEPRSREPVLPPVGSTVRAVVLGFTERPRQVRLSLRPSLLRRSERHEA